MGQQFTMAGAPMEDTTTSSANDAVINTSTISRINRAYVTSQNAMVDVSKSQASVIQNQIDALDAQINSLLSQISSTTDLRDTQSNIYNTLSAEIAKSDSLPQISPYKLTNNQRKVKVENRDKAYQALQTHSYTISSLTNDKDVLLNQRNALADKLTAMGKPVPRRANLNIEGKTGTFVDKIKDTISNVVTNQSDSGSVFRPSPEQLDYMMMGRPEEIEATNIAQTMKKNPIITYVAIGLGAVILYKLFIK